MNFRDQTKADSASPLDSKAIDNEGGNGSKDFNVTHLNTDKSQYLDRKFVNIPELFHSSPPIMNLLDTFLIG